MSATLVQSKSGTSSLATPTIALDNPPAPGNLLILSFASDAYNSSAGSGWTESTQMGLRSGSNHGAYKWWRVVSSSTNSFTYTIGSAATSAWVLEEWSGLSNTPYDVSASQFSNGGSTGYTTPAVTPTAGGRLLHAGINGSTSGGLGVPGTWTNSFTGVASIVTATGGTDVTIGTATREVTADGATAYSTGADYATGAPSRSGLILAFKLAAPAPPSNTTPASVSGVAQVEQTLTTIAGAWTGTPTPTVTGKWQRSDNGTSGWSDIIGATGTTYLLVDADDGKFVAYLESATNTEGSATQRSNVLGPVAPAPPLAVSFRLSGGASNNNPAVSIGGVESSVEVAGSTLFDAVTAQQATDGLTEYRLIYLHNDDDQNGTAIVYLVNNVSFPGRTFFAVGAATQAAGVTVTAVANDTTAPAGVTFNTGTSTGAGVNLGTIPAGLGKGVWIRRTIPSSTPANVPSNPVRIRFQITPS